MKVFAVAVSILMLTMLGHTSYAQLGVGASHIFAGGPKTWADGDLEALKRTKTIFVYGPRDADELENWKKVMRDVWTVTPVEFVSYENLKDFQDKPGYSFITLRFLDRSHTDSAPWRKPSQSGSDMSVSILNTFLQLGMAKEVDGKQKYVSFFRLELYPTFPTVDKVLRGGAKDPTAFAYTEAAFHNYYPGLQKHLLQQANALLSTGTSRKLYFTVKDGAKLSPLKSETLYVPEYVLIDYHKVTGDESKRFDAAKLMAAYKYKYEILPAKALSDKIVAGEKINYFVHSKSSTDNYFSVFTSAGEWAYSRYKAITYVVKADDFEDIVETSEAK